MQEIQGQTEEVDFVVERFEDQRTVRQLVRAVRKQPWQEVGRMYYPEDQRTTVTYFCAPYRTRLFYNNKDGCFAAEVELQFTTRTPPMEVGS